MLTLEEVEHIAALARLELTPEEKERFQQQLSDILDYAVSLQQVDTRAIPPTPSVLTLRNASLPLDSNYAEPANALRPDKAEPGLNTEDLLQNAPSAEGNQFRVPPVLNVE
ncbi:MAG: Asp-tRNA(Asn)/Glu-tRNA(Gln) amidotransferase subunit GatC [Anaerolineaceae bacterium]|nr:Asp-tRNA(Asn)/Glu-tRNA(Gln) amidotransferase subunit GatC [Anaerolineaceae bacterium]